MEKENIQFIPQFSHIHVSRDAYKDQFDDLVLQLHAEEDGDQRETNDDEEGEDDFLLPQF